MNMYLDLKKGCPVWRSLGSGPGLPLGTPLKGPGMNHLLLNRFQGFEIVAKRRYKHQEPSSRRPTLVLDALPQNTPQPPSNPWTPRAPTRACAVCRVPSRAALFHERQRRCPPQSASRRRRRGYSASWPRCVPRASVTRRSTTV